MTRKGDQMWGLFLVTFPIFLEQFRVSGVITGRFVRIEKIGRRDEADPHGLSRS